VKTAGELTNPDMAAADLPAALYLNQRLVFDLLASYEGGFSQLQDIQISSGTAASSEQSAQASLGTGNVFALLGISFGLSGKKSKAETDSQIVTEQRVHTPTSLFARLRQRLKSTGLLKYPSGGADMKEVTPGDFVEMKLVLQRSPFVTTLSGFARLFPLIAALQEPTPQPKQAKQGSGAPKSSSAGSLKKQIDAMLDAVRGEGSEDLIGRGAEGLTVVLTAELSHFIDPTLNDVIDGEFSVLGKVTRVVPDANEPAISLLRKTALSMFGDQIVVQFSELFDQLSQAGIKMPLVETEIAGPALQVIPISIFA